MRFLVLFFLLMLMMQTAYAGDESMSASSPLYPFKIWIEKFSLNFIFNQTEKSMRMMELADERLDEAKKVENNSLAFEKAMDAYIDQLIEIEKMVNNYNKSDNINIKIIKKIESQRNRVKAFKGENNATIIQENIIKAVSSSEGISIRVTSINGNVSINSSDENAAIKKDGNNISIISVTNGSRQVIIINRSGSTSSSSSQQSSVNRSGTSSIIVVSNITSISEVNE